MEDTENTLDFLCVLCASMLSASMHLNFYLNVNSG